MSSCAIFGLLTLQAVLSSDFSVLSSGVVTKGITGEDIYVPYAGDDMIMKSLENGEYFEEYTTYQYFNENDTDPYPSMFDNVTSLYNDVDKLNSMIAANSMYGQISVGNLIICQECDGTSHSHIGPNTNVMGVLQNYYPIYINSNWNLNQIINAGNTSFFSSTIYVSAFYYAVHYELSDALTQTKNAIHDKLFPNRTSFKSISHPTPLNQDGSIPDYAIFGRLKVIYGDMEKLWADLGDPSVWSSIYNDYYWRQSTSLVIYIYGLSVQCPNDNLCQQFLAGPTSTMEPTTTDNESSACSHNKEIWLFLILWIFFNQLLME